MSTDAAPITPSPAAPAVVDTPAPADTPSAPRSSSEIAAAVVAESEDTPARTATADPGDGTPAPLAPPAPPPTPPAPLTVEEELLAEFGFKDARRADGSEHRIPRSKVLQMIGSGLKRGQARWDGEKTSLAGERDTLKADLVEIATALRGDETQFLQYVASIDPRYQKFLMPRTDVARPAAPAPTDDPEPQATGELPNGQKFYTFEDLQKVRAWDRKHVERVLDQRLQPLADREKAAADTEARRTKVRAEMADAQQWPLFGAFPADGTFTPFQQEVLAELRADSEAAKAAGRAPTLALRAAYDRIVAKHIAGSDEAARARYAAELNAAPRSTSVARTGAEAVAHPNGRRRSTADIVRETISKLES